MKIILAIGIALSVIPGAATAQSRCPNAISQIDLTSCAAAAMDEASARLMRLLDALGTTLPADRSRSMGTVQRQWTEFMEAHCRWEGEAFNGGSMQPMLIAECRTALTNARIERLSAQLCEGTGTTADCVAARPYVTRSSPSKSRRSSNAKPPRHPAPY